MYVPDESGKRIYTLKKVLNGEVTKSAHPARFSPDDQYSRQRVTLKKRYGLLNLLDGKSRPPVHHTHVHAPDGRALTDVGAPHRFGQEACHRAVKPTTCAPVCV